MQDSLGDRMKLYEGREAQRRALPRLPVMVRVDGKGFSRWTRGLVYPFDERLELCRQHTMRRLIQETSAIIGFHQSDELSLVLHQAGPLAHIYADGRYQKIVSHTASIATVAWREAVDKYIPEKAQTPAYFDSRVWEVPSMEEAANTLMWREWDATKNSVSMLARSVFSHKELQGKNSVEMQEMLVARGIDWSTYPAWATRGTYMGRRSYNRALSPEELAALPPKHDAHRNPHMVVSRSEIKLLDLPPMRKIQNRVDVLMGADPIVNEDS